MPLLQNKPGNARAQDRDRCVQPAHSPGQGWRMKHPPNPGGRGPWGRTGLLAQFESEHKILRDFKLTSWGYPGPPPQRLVPRALRKLKIARGFMVYEGLG